jgi:NAD-reducing hydrogenase large subunit
LAQERVHPAWIVPGGVATPLAAHAREHSLSELPKAKAIAERTIQVVKGALDNYQEEIEFPGSFPSMYAGPVDAKGRLQLYGGNLGFRKTTGELAEDQIEPDAYKEWIGEASLRDSYLKAPYLKPLGFPTGVYRVGPLGA